MNEKKKAILFLHGIQERPKIFDPYLKWVPEDWKIQCLLLAGHEASLKEFGRASMKIWRKQVDEAVDKLLEDHEIVVIVGHSMGTLFAIEQAIKKPISALFLLETPLKIRITRKHLKMMAESLLNPSRSQDPYYQAAINAWSVPKEWRIWQYGPFAMRYLELFVQIARTRRMTSLIHTPTLAFFALEDEMVSPASKKYFADNPLIQIHELEHSGHFYMPETDGNLVYQSFARMLESLDGSSI